MIDILVWPAVVVVFLIVYRSWMTSTVSQVVRGRRISKFKAGPLEIEWDAKVDETARNVAGALTETSKMPRDDGEIPTNLVDLLPVTSVNPSRGVQAAFHQVCRALVHEYPSLSSTPTAELPAAVRDLVRAGLMDPQVGQAFTQLSHLLDLSESAPDAVSPTGAYLFLSLAEGAIHAILRSARTAPSPAGAPMNQRWQGTYDNDYPIELVITEWDDLEFRGTMTYPDTDTVTEMTGRIDRENEQSGRAVVWHETRVLHQGRQRVDLNGEYRAEALSDVMVGSWFQGARLVANFRMNAVAADRLPPG